MAYDRENLLKKIVEIQDIVLEHKRKFVPQVRIFREYIEKQYHISYSTFNQYLSIPAHAQLKKLQAQKEKQEEEGEIITTVAINIATVAIN
jgi:hypothetical protein